MKRVFLVFGNDSSHVSLRQILSGGKGLFSIFIEDGCATASIEEVLKLKDTRAEYIVSQTQTGMRYSNGGVTDSAKLLTDIVNAAIDNVIVVMNTANCKEFAAVLKERLGATSEKENHFTCEVSSVKFAALADAYAVPA